MTTKTKTAGILLGTLALGFILGALFSGAWRARREQRLSLFSPQQRLQMYLEKELALAARQRAFCDSVLTQRFQPLATLYEQAQNEVYFLYDSLQHDLAPILSEQQRQQLQTQIAALYNRRLRERIASLSRVLKLDEEQQKRIAQLVQTSEEQARAERQAYRHDPAALQQAAQLRGENLRRQIEALLTPQQREKFREVKSALRPQLMQ